MHWDLLPHTSPEDSCGDWTETVSCRLCSDVVDSRLGRYRGIATVTGMTGTSAGTPDLWLQWPTHSPDLIWQAKSCQREFEADSLCNARIFALQRGEDGDSTEAF